MTLNPAFDWDQYLDEMDDKEWESIVAQEEQEELENGDA